MLAGIRVFCALSLLGQDNDFVKENIRWFCNYSSNLSGFRRYTHRTAKIGTFISPYGTGVVSFFIDNIP
jgi:hypothetical protein